MRFTKASQARASSSGARIPAHPKPRCKAPRRSLKRWPAGRETRPRPPHSTRHQPRLPLCLSPPRLTRPLGCLRQRQPFSQGQARGLVDLLSTANGNRKRERERKKEKQTRRHAQRNTEKRGNHMHSLNLISTLDRRGLDRKQISNQQ